MMLLLNKFSYDDDENIVIFDDDSAHATKQLNNKVYFETGECIKKVYL